MIETLEGGCACGEVRYRLASAPMFVHCCHCLNCQRHTGSAFVINLLIETARVELLKGAPQPVIMPLNGGSPNRIFRCPACQVAVWSEYGAARSIGPPPSRPTCTSTRGRSCPGSGFPTRSRPSTAITIRRRSGRPRASIGARPHSVRACRVPTASSRTSRGSAGRSARPAAGFPGRAPSRGSSPSAPLVHGAAVRGAPSHPESISGVSRPEIGEST